MTKTRVLRAGAPLLTAAACVLLALRLAFSAAAGESRDGIGVQTAATELAPATQARYRIGYMHSETVGALRSATVVTVNNEAAAPCTVSVDWLKGSGAVACTTTVDLGPGRTFDFCSRPLPGAVTACNVVCMPNLVFDEGSAVVGSPTTGGCGALTISARTYYFAGSDTAISGVVDPGVTRFGTGSRGD